ncbi:MAG: hypothetical protein HYY62_00695, partial [Deltaproteobacteria bacterium]|nr:hypothetical protein [Deltaproteobacteria bacterium]
IDPRTIRAQRKDFEIFTQDPGSQLYFIGDRRQTNQEAFFAPMDPRQAEGYIASYMTPRLEAFMRIWQTKKEMLDIEVSKDLEQLTNEDSYQYIAFDWFDFPKNLAETLVIQETCLRELERDAQSKPDYLDLIQKAKARFFAKKMILIQTLKNIN